MRPHPGDMDITGLSPVTKAAQDNRAVGMVSGATRHER